MQLRFLGTGTPMPDPRRAGQGTAVLTGASDRGWMLVDCGRGVPQRALEAGLDLRALAAVLLTHHHSDHVSDLATLAITRFVAGAMTPLRVIAPDGPARRFATSCLDAHDDTAFYSQHDAGRSIRPEVEVVPFRPTSEPTRVLGSNGVTVEAVRVDHGPMEAASGYRISDGTAVVVLSGDTTACDAVRRLAQGADVLVHQALRTDRVARAALTWNASARSVGELARSAAVGHLVLTHLLPPPANAADEEAFATEARAGGYEGAVTIAQDLGVLNIP